MTYSEAIRKYRKEQGMSMEKLAVKLGVTRQAVSLWENGINQPGVDWLIQNAPKSDFHRIVLEALYPQITVR